MHHVRRAITGLVVIACATLGAQQSRSSWSGVYTTAQAAAGEKIYGDKCASCHGADLAGIERAPALAGGTFLDSWHGSDLRRLLERIDTMPPAAPKSLSSAESLALLAFLLRAAEMPAGPAALPADRAQLAGITFERARSAVRLERTGVHPCPDRCAGRNRGAAAASAHIGRYPLMAHLRRQSRQSPLLARRPDHKGQLQQPADRVAAEDRLPWPTPRHALFGHTAARRSRAVHDGRHAARGDRPQPDQRRNAVDAQRGRGAARPERDS